MSSDPHDVSLKRFNQNTVKTRSWFNPADCPFPQAPLVSVMASLCSRSLTSAGTSPHFSLLHPSRQEHLTVPSLSWISNLPFSLHGSHHDQVPDLSLQGSANWSQTPTLPLPLGFCPCNLTEGDSVSGYVTPPLKAFHWLFSAPASHSS